LSPLTPGVASHTTPSSAVQGTALSTPNRRQLAGWQVVKGRGARCACLCRWGWGASCWRGAVSGSSFFFCWLRGRRWGRRGRHFRAHNTPIRDAINAQPSSSGVAVEQASAARQR
jgi:hypothetical protein